MIHSLAYFTSEYGRITRARRLQNLQNPTSVLQEIQDTEMPFTVRVRGREDATKVDTDKTLGSAFFAL